MKDFKSTIKNEEVVTKEKEKTLTFSELSDIDKKEIMNLIEFKRRYKESLNR